MKILGNNIRWSVIFFSMVLALVLYQTGDGGYGTIAALSTMALTIISIGMSCQPIFSFRFGKHGSLLFWGMIYIILTQIVLAVDSSMLVKLCSQMFLTCVLFSVTIDRREHRYLTYIFEIAMTMYAVIVVHNIILNPLIYVHAKIPMFGTAFDPNFIGLPLVAGTAFLLHDILNEQKKLRMLAMSIAYCIIAYAVFQTASRSNLLALALSSGFIMIDYLRTNKRSIKSYITIAVITVAAIFAIGRLMIVLEDNFARMTDFGEDADNNRFYLWQHSLDVFLDNFLFGGGFDSVTTLYGHESHNLYLQLLSETGLVGFIIFVTFFVRMYKKAIGYEKIMGIVVIVLFFQSFFLNSFNSRYFWALLGWVAMLPNQKDYSTT